MITTIPTRNEPSQASAPGGCVERLVRHIVQMKLSYRATSILLDMQAFNPDGTVNKRKLRKILEVGECRKHRNCGKVTEAELRRCAGLPNAAGEPQPRKPRT